MAVRPIPDQTIFTICDQGDRSVGIPPMVVSLTYDREIDREHFPEVLSHLNSLAQDEDWHGDVTAFVSYVYGSGDPEVQHMVPRFFKTVQPT